MITSARLGDTSFAPAYDDKKQSTQVALFSNTLQTGPAPSAMEVADKGQKSSKPAASSQTLTETPQAVAIAAYNEAGKGKNVFEPRAKHTKAPAQMVAHTGRQFIQDLVDASKKGPISTLYIASHGNGDAVYMNCNKGLYNDRIDKWSEAMFGDGQCGSRPLEGAATMSDLEAKVKSGEIRFTHDAKIYFTGCQTGQYPAFSWANDSIAEKFSKIVPGAQVTAPLGYTFPKASADGRSDSNTYITKEYNKPDSPGASWATYQNGKQIWTSPGEEFELPVYHPSQSK